MDVYLNNIKHELTEATTVSEAVNLLSAGSLKGIAVAVNNNVVPKGAWETTLLTNNDKLTIIQATQGG